MQAETLEIQRSHPPIATVDPFAFFALEERGGTLERVQLAYLRAVMLEPLALAIPKQLHQVVPGALEPLLQLVVNARGNRLALQIVLDALRPILVLERVQDRQAAEDRQVREDGRGVIFPVILNILASGR